MSRITISGVTPDLLAWLKRHGAGYGCAARQALRDVRLAADVLSYEVAMMAGAFTHEEACLLADVLRDFDRIAACGAEIAELPRLLAARLERDCSSKPIEKLWGIQNAYPLISRISQMDPVRALALLDVIESWHAQRDSTIESLCAMLKIKLDKNNGI